MVIPAPSEAQRKRIRRDTHRTLPIFDDHGEEYLAAEKEHCEYCGGPCNHKGESTAYNVRTVEESIRQLAQALWDSPQTTLVTIATVVMAKRGPEIADKLQELTGKAVTRQDVYHHRIRAARMWQNLSAVVMPRGRPSKNKNPRYTA